MLPQSLVSTCLFVLGLSCFSSAYALKPGDTAPEINIPALSGSAQISLSELKGKVVYVDFWASWCPPCVKSFPLLNDLRNKLQDQGFEVLAVNLDEERSDAEAFLKAHAVDFLVGVDDSKQLPISYEVKGMPYAYLVDKQGLIQYVYRGFNAKHMPEIEANVTSLLKK